jgi:hypothetical protein
MRLASLLGICGTPVAFLTLLSVDHALLSPACEHQSSHWLHIGAVAT